MRGELPVQVQNKFRLAAISSGLAKKNDNPGCFSGVAIKHRKLRSKVHQPKLMLPQLLGRNHSHGRSLGHNRSTNVFRIQADHLSRLR